MFLFVEDGIRGGISMITHRYAKANHPDLESAGYYDKAKPLCKILYLDANNLYGWAMMQCLPVSDFRWLSQEKIETKMTLEKISAIPRDSKRGYILEVDMHLPEELHDKMSDYPLAPEKKPVLGTQLSNYQQQILREDMIESSAQVRLIYLTLNVLRLTSLLILKYLYTVPFCRTSNPTKRVSGRKSRIVKAVRSSSSTTSRKRSTRFTIVISNFASSSG